MSREVLGGAVEAAEKLAALSRGRLRSKLPAMQLALEGRMTEHHRWMLRVLHEQLVFVEAQITKLEAKIQDQLSDYQEAIALCTTIPGIEEVAAANLIAEIGGNMAQFPSAQHLASWARICPGNNESAGKRLSGKPRKGSAWLRRSLLPRGPRPTPRRRIWRPVFIGWPLARARSAPL